MIMLNPEFQEWLLVFALLLSVFISTDAIDWLADKIQEYFNDKE